MTGEPDRCRPVDVDVETIRVHGAGELDDIGTEALAVLVRAAKQRMRETCTCGHLKGEHRMELKRQYCATGAEIPGYACEQKCQRYTPQET